MSFIYSPGCGEFSTIFIKMCSASSNSKLEFKSLNKQGFIFPTLQEVCKTFPCYMQLL